MLDATFCELAEPAHLIAAARASLNPLTSTPLELELLKRFEELHEEHAGIAPLQTLAWEHDFDADEVEALCESHPASIKEMTKLLSALNDAGVHDLSDLKPLLTATQE